MQPKLVNQWSFALAAVAMLFVVYVASYPIAVMIHEHWTAFPNLCVDAEQLPLYRPVDWMIDRTSLYSPIMWLAEVVGVEFEMQNAYCQRNPTTCGY